ncbi:lipoprotein signal peptidase [Synechococcus sp. PCC 7502]|uniref:signal peptidase II n=1 Tax=Synechococcus sp. PCC 7502 TaxID=1173263 RepID=UPI00029FC674|nr:signal peptidase II [Synechococcus sp. PCC 7502]AFY75382.1 lipoprotein signal peptidase [Synechococcus sp. PCC 7502]
MLRNLYFWICALSWLCIDQLTKTAIAQNPSLHDLAIWQGILHLRYITNSGAAFSIFSGGSGWLKWVSLVVSFGLGVLGVFAKKLTIWEQCGYGCILGGALGNGLDRFIKGAVVDFLDLRFINFPVFNFADIAINVGLAFLLINFMQSSKKS